MEFQVEVKDPANEGSGRNMYTTYAVTGPNTLVRRRYSDFQWLYTRLMTELPGVVVPIIPHTHAILKHQKLAPELIQQRQQHMQSFLQAVVEHPELARAPSMTPFMTASMGDAFDTAKKVLEVNKPMTVMEGEDPSQSAIPTSPTVSKARKGLSNFIAKAKTLTQSMTGNSHLLTTPEEKQVEAVQKYVDRIESHVKGLVQASSQFLQVTQDTATATALLKEPLLGWTETHRKSIGGGDADETLDMMCALVEFSNDYSTLMEVKHSEELSSFWKSMQQLQYDVQAFSNALKQRKQWQVQYTTKFHQSIDKDAALEKAHKNLKGPEITQKLEIEKQVLQQESKIAKTTLEDCTYRVLREAHRVEPLLGKSLQQCFRQYAQIQVDYHERITNAWNQLLPYVGIGVNKEKETKEISKAQNEAATDLSKDDTPEPPTASPPPPSEEEEGA